mgnify:CR=1 FL=1
MKICFFDDEPEIYPLQYGGKARTITNLAKEFAKRPEVEKVTILSKSIKSNEKEFSIDGVNYIVLDDSNIIERIEREMMDEAKNGMQYMVLTNLMSRQYKQMNSIISGQIGNS